MKKHILITTLIATLAVSVVCFFILRKPDADIHYHAGFLVYIDGIYQDFKSSKYMKTEPCYTNTVKHPPEDNQKEKAHLHGGIGDVVHVHRDHALWGDLFKNIGFTFPATESATGYINGSPVNDILNYPIKAYDSIIITSGDTAGVDFNHYITEEHIKEVEAQSETCGK